MLYFNVLMSLLQTLQTLLGVLLFATFFFHSFNRMKISLLLRSSCCCEIFADYFGIISEVIETWSVWSGLEKRSCPKKISCPFRQAIPDGTTVIKVWFNKAFEYFNCGGMETNSLTRLISTYQYLTRIFFEISCMWDFPERFSKILSPRDLLWIVWFALTPSTLMFIV